LIAEQLYTGGNSILNLLVIWVTGLLSFGWPITKQRELWWAYA